MRISQQVKFGLFFKQGINHLKCVFLSIYLFSPQCNCASCRFPSITASNIWSPRLSTEAQMKTACCSHGGEQIAWIKSTSEPTYKGWLTTHTHHVRWTRRWFLIDEGWFDRGGENGWGRGSQMLMVLLTRWVLSFSNGWSVFFYLPPVGILNFISAVVLCSAYSRVLQAPWQYFKHIMLTRKCYQSHLKGQCATVVFFCFAFVLLPDTGECS